MLGCRGEVSGELFLINIEILSSKCDRKREGKGVQDVFKWIFSVREHVF